MPRLAANLSFFFKDRPFLQRFAASAQCGFSHVEFMFAGDTPNDNYVHEAAAVRRELQQHGLQQALLNAPAGDWSAGDRGLAGIASRAEEHKASIEYGLEYATAVGCSQMHVMAGTVAAGADEDTLVRSLQWTCALAADAGVTVLVEPLNAHDFPGYLIPDLATALRVVDAVGAPQHCKLQLDLYHVARAGGLRGDAEVADVVRALSMAQVAHVQVAAPPGRNEPGCGDFDFAPVFALLDGELAYDGVVGCEYKPSGGDGAGATAASLGWAEGFLTRRGVHST